MIIFIIISAIGWLISLGTAIAGMVVSWGDKDKNLFDEALILFVLSIFGGFVIGWILVGFYIKVNWIDSHFN